MPPQKTRRLQCPGREARRRMRARGPRVSPGPPALLAPAGTCRTSWGPWSGRGRAAVQDALPHPRPDRGLGRGGRSSGAPPPLAPPRPRPRPRLLNALAAAAASSEPLACPRRQLRSDRRGHGGVPGPDHVASAASTARAAPTLRPSPRPGHGRPRRPPERGATGGTRGRAPGGRRAAAAGGRRGTGPRRRGGSRGCAAPPRGWACSGARAPPRLLREGLRTSRKKETAGGAFASRAPNFAKCVTLRPGRAEVWGHPCWVPGWCGPAFLAHCPLSAPTTRRWPRAARPASRCSCWRCPPARGCPPGPSRTHVAAALRPRAPGRAQSRATRPAEAAGAATATRSSPSSSDRHGSWSAGPGHASG